MSRRCEPPTSVIALRSSLCGVHWNVERERRKRSVEDMVTESPSKRIWMPVSTGRLSSRATATAAWFTDCVKVCASTWPSCGGSCGRSGYSVSGMSCNVNVDLPEVICSVDPLVCM